MPVPEESLNLSDIDAGVEKMPDSPRDASVPLTKGGAGKPVAGRRYVGSLGYEL